LALLDRECAGRPEIRQRLNRLLEAHVQSRPMLDRPNACKPDVTGAYEPSAPQGRCCAGRLPRMRCHSTLAHNRRATKLFSGCFSAKASLPNVRGPTARPK
jgi:hypothetical protein